MKSVFLSLFLSVSFGYSSLAFCDEFELPQCIGEDKKELSVNNHHVIQLKQKKNARPFRALIAGKVSRVFPERCNRKGTCHDHFEIQIGSNSDDTVEVVYNSDFGSLPKIQVGTDVQTCGDFINTSAQEPPRGPVSPSGAIIHWVHKSGCMNHENGYVSIEGKLFGFGEDRKSRPCPEGVPVRVN